MTALPKHRPSSRRQGRRRATHTATTLAKIVVCKHCNQPKKVGFECANCKQS
ncbi:MAG TPA: 50S ribosomal protein L32 [Candidatus Woesebacteria bacterium]|nr:50S ribosomal protein L32 [Candidatus Woesebacteria bacterium]